MVPGSTLMYGSNFWMLTSRPRAASRRPSEALKMPLPREEVTPPVTKIYLVCTAGGGLERRRRDGGSDSSLKIGGPAALYQRRGVSVSEKIYRRGPRNWGWCARR